MSISNTQFQLIEPALLSSPCRQEVSTSDNSLLQSTPGSNSITGLSPCKFSPLPLLRSPLKQEADFSPFLAKIYDPKFKTDKIRALFTETESWMGLCHERSNDSRQKKTQGPSLEEFKKDQAITAEYKEILFYFTKHINLDKDLFITLSKYNTIQGMARYHKKTATELYVNTLFTAPWNLKMAGQLPEGSNYLAIQGVGLTLIATLCDVASRLECTELTLSSSGQSDGFYQHIGLYSPQPGSYTVNLQEQLPEKLSKAAFLFGDC